MFLSTVAGEIHRMPSSRRQLTPHATPGTTQLTHRAAAHLVFWMDTTSSGIRRLVLGRRILLSFGTMSSTLSPVVLIPSVIISRHQPTPLGFIQMSLTIKATRRPLLNTSLDTRLV